MEQKNTILRICSLLCFVAYCQCRPSTAKTDTLLQRQSHYRNHPANGETRTFLAHRRLLTPFKNPLN